MDLPIVHIEKGEAGGFFIEDPDGDGYLAELTYHWAKPGIMAITHTAVGERLAGQGVSRRLGQAAVDKARADGFKIIPQCAHQLRLFNKTPDWADVWHKY